jgi:hypothetical protein
MTWRRVIVLVFAVMLASLLPLYFVVARQALPGASIEVLGARSVFPAGPHAAVSDARNGWQGFAFAGGLRFFQRPAGDAAAELQALKREHFAAAPLQADLDLFAGGFFAMRRANKGYRLFCVFREGGTVYWADMRSSSSLDFALRAFERFIVNLEIGGRRAGPRVAGQLAALRRRIPWLTVQTPAQFFLLMGGIFALTLLIVYSVFRFSGAPPRRPGAAEAQAAGGGREWCAPYATLRVGGFGRRKTSACCLCLEGDTLVVYRFRRPFMSIDLRQERQELEWERSGFRYKNIRVMMDYADFEKWRLRLMG